MRSFFESMTPWPRNDGALHVYALPDDAVADRLEELSTRLDGVAGLPRMPRTWLHLTVRQLSQFDDLGQAELTRLCDELGLALSGLARFELTMGAPTAHETTVNCEVEPSQPWDALVGAVRSAATSFAGDPLHPDPYGPHVTLAYATGEVDDREVRERLADAPAVGQVPIRQVHLVSVTVRPEIGTFDWTELANWELRG